MSFRRLIVVVVCASSLAPFGALASATGAESVRGGAEIYAVVCLRCHGEGGRGTDEYESQLEGDLSANQLADLIQETMPADDPGTLSSEEARELASYVHDAFYSEVARSRNRPARIELAHLTASQYRGVVADLIGDFRSRTAWSERRGLTGEYYAARRGFGGRRRRRPEPPVAVRVDAQVAFDFGTTVPIPELSDPHAFSITWSGSILAPETGEYEFALRTDQPAELWINRMDRALVDATIRSAGATEFREPTHLIGGRGYPIRLTFRKVKPGIDDPNNKEEPPPTPASLALLWRRPRGALQVIPTRFLSPDAAEESFVCTTRFPPDDGSYGWIRGVGVSQAWDEATTNAAIEAAAYVAERLDKLAGVDPGADDRADKLRTYCRTFVERAFRTPIDDELAEAYVDRLFAEAGDPDTAVRRVVLLTLKSPRFLFRELGAGPDEFDVAARLSFGLWDSLPDEELWDAARTGRLADDGEIRRQAERMLSDQRAKAKLLEFLLTWLNTRPDADLQKDPEKFPGFDAEAIADLRTSLELFLEEVAWSESSDYRRLLLADEVYLNGRLASLFGAEAPSGDDFVAVKLDGGQRAGVLTHPYVMAQLAHASETSPIHRGLFLVRNMLGQRLRPPPEAFAPFDAELHPTLTTRERVALQTQPTTCMGCHRIINPLGFTLERFDAVGRIRDSERGKPIDDSGSYQSRDGEAVALHGARDVAEYLASNEDAHAAFVEHLFHHLVQQPVEAYGPETLNNLRRSFSENGFHVRQLAVDVLAATARIKRSAESTPPAQTEELTARRSIDAP